MRLPAKIPGIAFFLREYFFPVGCSACGRGLINAAEAWYGLCGDCHAGIELDLNKNMSFENCDLCGKPLISEHKRCISCRKSEDSVIDRVKVLFPYRGKYRRLLASYKFGKNLALGNFFTEKITEAWGFCIAGMSTVSGTSIVPVPPRPGKIRKTGWDQIEYLARLLEGKGMPVNRCIKRLPSKSQKELDKKDRQTNLQGRIVPIRETPRTAVLIDDVMTTGATLEACTAVLKKAGAEKVYGLCLFYD